MSLSKVAIRWGFDRGAVVITTHFMNITGGSLRETV
jgi:hypothetical protein